MLSMVLCSWVDEQLLMVADTSKTTKTVWVLGYRTERDHLGRLSSAYQSDWNNL